VPVTSKAQASEQYQDYLSRSGEDNSTYYDVKIQASKLLLEHVGDTFVTPVFNGSTSLRDAAGQLIENVAKSVRRKETVDDAYIDGLYSDITSLYRLDQTNAAVSGRQELGSLPTTSVVLLSALGLAWVLIILYVIVDFTRTKRR
jgi:multiple sugar transport system substrate-binding protein